MEGSFENESLTPELQNLDWLVNKSFIPSSVKAKLHAPPIFAESPDDFEINKKRVKSNLGGLYKYDVPEYKSPAPKKQLSTRLYNHYITPKSLRYFSSKSEKIVRENSSQIDDSSTLSSLGPKTAEMNKSCLENPQDCEKWLRLLKLQDDEFVSHFDSSEHSGMQHRRLVERKLAILARALEFNRENLTLVLERLRLLEQIEDHVTVRRHYDHLLLTQTSQPLFWERYIGFVKRSSVANFSFLRTARLYEKAISTLLAAKRRRITIHDSAIFELIISYIDFLTNCGYLERSITIIQCLLEFNTKTPASLSKSLTPQLLNHFDNFFQSGQPLIGQQDSTGWDKFDKSQKPPQYLIKEDLPIDRDDINREKLWIYLERLRDYNHWIPLRDQDNIDECEDVDRLCSFSDVQTALCHIDETEDLTNLAHLGANTVLQYPRFSTELDFFPNNDDFERMFFSKLVLHFGINPEGVNGSLQFVLNIAESLEAFNVDLATSLYKSTLIREFVLTEKPAYNFHDHSKYSSVKKMAKQLLSKRIFRNSLPFYSFYMFTEFLEGNLKLARKLFYSVTQGFSQPDRLGLLIKTMKVTQLYDFLAQFVELELGFSSFFFTQNNVILQRKCDQFATSETSSTETDALRALCVVSLVWNIEDTFSVNLMDRNTSNSVKNIISGDISPTTTLHAHRLFSKIPEGHGNSSICHCHGIFSLLVNGWDCCETTYLTHLRINHSQRLVRHFMCLIRSLFYQRKLTASKVGDLINECIPFAPNEFSLLSLIIEINSTFLHAQRARNAFLAAWHQKRSPQTIIMHILYELEALNGSNVLPQRIGLINRIRKLYNDFCVLPESGSCPLIWRMFMKFENDHGTKNDVDSVYFRSIQICPWCKDLYMDYLVYSPENLDEVVSVMVDKGIRVRVPIEEIELLIGIEMRKIELDN